MLVFVSTRDQIYVTFFSFFSFLTTQLNSPVIPLKFYILLIDWGLYILFQYQNQTRTCKKSVIRVLQKGFKYSSTTEKFRCISSFYICFICFSISKNVTSPDSPEEFVLIFFMSQIILSSIMTSYFYSRDNDKCVKSYEFIEFNLHVSKDLISTLLN